MVTHIQQLVSDIDPFDQLEADHQADVLAWIASGDPLFRISKPDNPPKHLVSYFIVHDIATDKLLLINHLKSGLLLPAGGHVDLDEDPATTVIREAEEELGLAAVFQEPYGNLPLFITATTTLGQGQHTDVSLWYLVQGDTTQTYIYEAREMSGYEWFSLAEIMAMDQAKLDPHMHRFVRKMQKAPA